MNVGTLVAAAVGAVIGVGSTLITDFVRARRDLDQKWLETKRLVYVRFLVALAQAHSRINVAAFEQLAPAEKKNAVHRAFHDDPQNAEAKAILRELAITAPEHIYRLALEVYECLRTIRDVLFQSTITAADAKYRQANKPFWTGLETLQDVMREDLRSGTRYHRKDLLRRRATRTRETDPPLMAADQS